MIQLNLLDSLTLNVPHSPQSNLNVQNLTQTNKHLTVLSMTLSMLQHAARANVPSGIGASRRLAQFGSSSSENEQKGYNKAPEGAKQRPRFAVGCLKEVLRVNIFFNLPSYHDIQNVKGAPSTEYVHFAFLKKQGRVLASLRAAPRPYFCEVLAFCKHKMFHGVAPLSISEPVML